MEGRGIKRNIFIELKNDLCVELHNLTIESGNIGNDLHYAIDDFEQFWRSMIDRQGDFLTRCVLLEENFRRAISVIEGGPQHKGGECSGENVVLPRVYAEDTLKFVNDVKTSLNTHEKLMAEGYKEMEKGMEKHAENFNQKLKELKDMTGKITTQKEMLSKKLFEFSRSMIVD